MNENLFVSNHNFSFPNSAVTASDSSWDFSAMQNKFVGAAKMTNFKISKKNNMSLMYSVNNLGPKVHPCGTPHVISKDFTYLHKLFSSFLFEYCDQLCQMLSLSQWKHPLHTSCCQSYLLAFLLSALKP